MSARKRKDSDLGLGKRAGVAHRVVLDSVQKLMELNGRERSVENKELFEIWEAIRKLAIVVRDLEKESLPSTVARKINRISRENRVAQPASAVSDEGGAA